MLKEELDKVIKFHIQNVCEEIQDLQELFNENKELKSKFKNEIKLLEYFGIEI